MIGKLVGHYRVLEKIGAGGMGEVFRARDERLGRDVALKLIRPASSDNPDHLHRFEHEARAAAALNHPNIVAIFDVGFEGTTPYIVSELLEGKTLRQRLSEGPLPIRTATGYALQIAEALIAAHERRIVHRDLKPENLFITNDERVKILDFGVAKLQPSGDQNRSIESLTTITKHGAVVGTVAYMAPEQLRGKSVDHRSDIFSFGAILYEMLTGSRAFHGETEVDTMTAVLREEPPSTKLDEAAIPSVYQDVLRHCLEKEPDDRFQSAKDLAFALQTISGSSPVRPSDFSHWKSRKKNWLPWTISAVLATAVVVLGLAQLLQAPATQPKYERLTFESGTIYSARFGSDGHTVLYSAAWNNQPVRLFSTVGNSTLSQPLQFSDASLLGVSRSGDNLALVMHGTQSGQLEIANGMLASAPMAGGSPREMLNDVRWADWDPDGKLAVVHYNEGHCRLEYPIGNVLYRSAGWIGNIRFSPDGKSIAFMDHPVLWDNRGRVRVTDVAGHVNTLTQEWESAGGLAWRSDGKEIWFAAVNKGMNLNLMAVNLSGKIRTLLDLPVAINLQDVAPDGRVLVSLNSTRLSMEYTRLDSKEGVDLAWHDWNSAREISHDGKFLLFEDASEAAGPNYAVATRNVDGSLPVRLGEGSSGGLSPDGKWAISILPNSTSQLKLLPLGAGEPQDVNVSGLDHLQSGWARFFPDGQHIALNGGQSGHANRCYTVEVSNGVAKPVTPEGIVCGPLSPDGVSLVGTAADRSIAIYSLTGGTPKQVPNFGTSFVAVQWADDGNSLYCYRPGEFPSQVYRVEIATGKAEVVKELKPGVTAGVVMVAPIVVSRDGKYFAYSYNQTLSALYLISGLH
ncbi:MAG TPA: protein kinase [Candidatus Eisenbacteria bacterium]|nr:protein kinase [Candidatus Eisenbacteria bacterium]